MSLAMNGERITTVAEFGTMPPTCYWRVTTLSTSLPHSPCFWPVYLGLAFLRWSSSFPLSWLRGLGSALGLLIYCVSAERRRITQINLALCFPELTEQQRKVIARRCFREGGQAILELALIWFGDKARVYRAGTLSGIEHIEAARAQGRGVLLIGFHTNDLELGATSISDRVKNISGMYRPHSNVVFDRAMFGGRTRYFPMIDRGDSRGAVRWLKSGNILWYAPDQDYGAAQSVFAPFFGHPAATITATTRLAKLSNALVIPMTHFRSDKGINVQLHAPLPIPGDSDVGDASAINAFLADYLRHHPSNYMWMHRRFKTRPDGAPSLYPERASNKTRLSVKRLNHYEKNGVLVAGHFKDWRYYQIAPTELALLATRSWWRPQHRSVAALKQQITDWQQQQLPCATFLRQTRCSARSVDGLHLEFPPGKPLLLIDPPQIAEHLQRWQQRYPDYPVDAMRLWLGDDQSLHLIP